MFYIAKKKKTTTKLKNAQKLRSFENVYVFLRLMYLRWPIDIVWSNDMEAHVNTAKSYFICCIRNRRSPVILNTMFHKML